MGIGDAARGFYYCVACGKEGHRKEQLRQHVSAAHGPYICPYEDCYKSAESQNQLSPHIRQVHGVHGKGGGLAEAEAQDADHLLDPDEYIIRTVEEPLPAYLKEGLERQDAETLYYALSWVEEELRDRGLNPWPGTGTGTGSDSSEKAIRQERAGKWTLREEEKRCGKEECSSCPHGPYWYAYRSVRGSTRSIYLGRAASTEEAKDALVEKLS